jgi:hypothetical protein
MKAISIKWWRGCWLGSMINSISNIGRSIGCPLTWHSILFIRTVETTILIFLCDSDSNLIFYDGDALHYDDWWCLRAWYILFNILQRPLPHCLHFILYEGCPHGVTHGIVQLKLIWFGGGCFRLMTVCYLLWRVIHSLLITVIHCSDGVPLGGSWASPDLDPTFYFCSLPIYHSICCYISILCYIGLTPVKEKILHCSLLMPWSLFHCYIPSGICFDALFIYLYYYSGRVQNILCSLLKWLICGRMMEICSSIYISGDDTGSSLFIYHLIRCCWWTHGTFDAFVVIYLVRWLLFYFYTNLWNSAVQAWVVVSMKALWLTYLTGGGWALQYTCSDHILLKPVFCQYSTIFRETTHIVVDFYHFVPGGWWYSLSPFPAVAGWCTVMGSCIRAFLCFLTGSALVGYFYGECSIVFIQWRRL